MLSIPTALFAIDVGLQNEYVGAAFSHVTPSGDYKGPPILTSPPSLLRMLMSLLGETCDYPAHD
jgi:hypothetical protein